MSEIIVFVSAFLLPFLYWRLMFVIAKDFAEKPKLVGRTGMQIHHLHYGMVLLLFGTILLLFSEKTMWVIILQGAGLGLMFDEFISSLMLPEHRAIGLELYRKSFAGTLILFTAIALAVLGGAMLYF